MSFEDWWKQNAIGLHAEQEEFLHCWNAAIDEAARWIAAPNTETEESRLMANALKRTPIQGTMLKRSQ